MWGVCSSSYWNMCSIFVNIIRLIWDFLELVFFWRYGEIWFEKGIVNEERYKLGEGN